jgi:rhodanese-related sulfurtransferase/CBS domain-containing protein
MPVSIERAELERLIAAGAQLVETLPEAQYEEGHLPGAISMPLKQLSAERAEQLDRDRPVIVYCWDQLCDLSPRAAHLLEALGFSEVYDYALGKVDWLAHGLPVEGRHAAQPTVGSLARDDVVTCGPDDRVGPVRERVAASAYPFALVIDAGGVVLGRLRASMLDCDPELSAVAVMEPGPSTIRPHKTAAGTAEDLASKELRWAIVTTPEGELIGVVAREQLERAAA